MFNRALTRHPCVRANAALIGAALVIAAALPGCTGDSSIPLELVSFQGLFVQKDVPPDLASNDFFGTWVASTASVAAVGAGSHDAGGIVDSGAVYVYELGAAGWSRTAKLVAPDALAGDAMGSGVAAGPGYIVAGATGKDVGGAAQTGALYFFHQTAGSWAFHSEFIAADRAPSDVLGGWVAASGLVVAAGAPGDDDLGSSSGSVYVLEFDGTNWNQIAKILAADGAANDIFGESLDLEDDVLVVGARTKTGVGPNSGAAYVFRRNGTGWVQEAKLTPTDAVAAQEFGFPVVISGNTIVVGAHFDQGAGTDRGAVYVFEHTSAGWQQTAKLTSPDLLDGEEFGSSVAVHGDTLMARGLNPVDGVFWYQRVGGQWLLRQRLAPPDTAAFDNFGGFTALGPIYSVFGTNADDDSGINSGSVYFYR